MPCHVNAYSGVSRCRSEGWALLALMLGIPLAACAQQDQTSAVVTSTNAEWVQGVGPGYRPTAGSGLTLNLSKGTAFCNGSVVNYAGGSLTMGASATNYVYLNPTASCAPASNTTGFSLGNVPVSTVVTSSSAITTITDDRTWSIPQPTGVASNGAASTGAVLLTGTAYPNLDHEPVGYTAFAGGGALRPLAGAWQIFRGTTSSPVTVTSTQGAQNIFTEIVADSSSSGSNSTTSPAAIRAYAIQAAGNLTNTDAIQGACQANAGNSSGNGCVALHGLGFAGAASVVSFGAWFQTGDLGFNAGQTGIEINTSTSFSGGRTAGQLRGMNVVNFPGTTATDNDWGILVAGYGKGIAFDSSSTPTATTAVSLLWVRNPGTATTNSKIKILSFESPQPGPFNTGLDFTNATFTNGAINSSSGTLFKLGKISDAGANNLAGVIVFSSQSNKTITFANAYAVPPVCVGSSQFDPGSGVRGPWALSTATTLQLVFSANVTGNVNYVCIANPN